MRALSSARFTARYAARSLQRGGRRSVLAVFCVAVGVMAIVALRLAGDMIDASLTGNVREVNGGDISVQATALPLSRAQLSVLDELKARNEISQYAALGLERATIRRGRGHIVQLFPLYSIDRPETFPLVGGAGIVEPPGTTTFAQALRKPKTIVLSEFAAEQAGRLHVGDDVHLTIVGGRGTDLTVSGVVANRLSVAGSSIGYVGSATLSLVEKRAETYGLVDATTPPGADPNAVASELRDRLPGTTVQTVQSALDQNVQASQQIREYLQIVGLLALLIGGIGIVNTMQVLLSRRRTEIATLKTVGYRRSRLYALFGLETGLIGLLGGVLGTALGAGISRFLAALIERLAAIHLTVRVNPSVLITGAVVGVTVSLIFGLLPIVRASAVRPQAVLRNLPEGRGAGAFFQSAALYGVIVVLFTVLAAALLGDTKLAVTAVIATLITLFVLATVFVGMLALMGRLPVPESFSIRYVVGVTAATIVAAAIARRAPAAGVPLLISVALGYVTLVLPRRLRTSLKLALRSLRRGRGRTTSTLVALFVGVFAVGLILVLGQDVSTKVDESLSGLASYNVFAIAEPADAPSITTVTQALRGVQRRKVTVDAPVRPLTVRGAPLSAVTGGGAGGPGDQFKLLSLSGVEGYDLAHNQLPETDASFGRTLAATDAGSNAVMLRADLQRSPTSLHVGDDIVVEPRSGGTAHSLHVVGFYQPVSGQGSQLRVKFIFQPLIVDRQVAASLGGSGLSTIVSLQVDPAHKLDALRRLENEVPGATVYDLSDLAAVVKQILSNLLTLLFALACLALFAGVVIIANTVALAMLERRREMGILKATGHSSASVLTQVLIENGIVGALGGLAGMAAVSIATAAAERFVLHTELAVGVPISLAVIAGVVVLATATACLVAWGPTRARPLEVLRYE